MGKFKINEVVYQILMHHINHYQQVKKIFKIDYDSQMILVTVYAHYLYQTLNLSLEKKIDDGLDWEEMFPVIKGLSR